MAGVAYPLNGDKVAELIIYDSALPDSTRAKVEQYLHAKYAAKVNPSPDTVIAFGFCPYVLNAGSSFTNFKWSTGATTQSISVTQSGTYWVTADDLFGYPTSDTIKVTFPGKFPLARYGCLLRFNGKN